MNIDDLAEILVHASVPPSSPAFKQYFDPQVIWDGVVHALDAYWRTTVWYFPLPEDPVARYAVTMRTLEVSRHVDKVDFDNFDDDLEFWEIPTAFRDVWYCVVHGLPQQGYDDVWDRKNWSTRFYVGQGSVKSQEYWSETYKEAFEATTFPKEAFLHGLKHCQTHYMFTG